VLIREVVGKERWLATRPTEAWREGLEVERQMLAAGELDEADAVRATLYPPGLLRRTDEAFDAFEERTARWRDPGDEEVLRAIEDVVQALNAVDEEFDDAFETPERDLLCSYIDEVVSGAGVDLDALAARQGVPRTDLTDRWRTW
jgi:hypothetical protein